MEYNIIPTGHRVLIDPVKVKITKGKIIIPENTKDREQRAGTLGKILAIGPLAWSDFVSPEPWAKVGDTVIFKAHQGMRVKNNPEDDDFLLLFQDADIAAVYTGEV